MRGKNLLSTGKGTYMTQFYQLEMYQSLRSSCGNVLQGNDILNICSSFSYYFAIEKNLPFLEFVEWCTNSYSPSKRVVMSHTTSKILCRVDAKTIHGILNLPNSFPDNCESLNEQFLVEIYKNCETKVRFQFLSSILKEGQSLEGLFLHYNVDIFKKYV